MQYLGLFIKACFVHLDFIPSFSKMMLLCKIFAVYSILVDNFSYARHIIIL